MRVLTRSLAMVVSLLWLVTSPIQQSWAQTPLSEPGAPSVTWNHSADAVILELRTETGMIAGDDNATVIRVFGDGAVEAYLPIYLKRAGTWRMQISDEELRSLVDDAVRFRIFDMRQSDLAEAVHQASRGKAATSDLVVQVSDPDITELSVRLQLEIANGVVPLEQTIRILDLQRSAREYPEVEGLDELAAFARRIDAFSQSSNMARISQ